MAKRAIHIDLSEIQKQVQERINQKDQEEQEQLTQIINKRTADSVIDLSHVGTLPRISEIREINTLATKVLTGDRSPAELNDLCRECLQQVTLWLGEEIFGSKPVDIYKTAIPIHANDTPNVHWRLNKHKEECFDPITFRSVISSYLAQTINLLEFNNNTILQDLNTLNFKAPNPYGPALMKGKDSDITPVMFPNTIRFGLELVLDAPTRTMTIVIYDPILHHLLSEATLHNEDLDQKCFKLSEVLLLTGQVNFDELVNQILQIAKVLYCSGGITQCVSGNMTQKNINPLPGTLFTFGFHQSVKDGYGLIQITDEYKTSWTTAAWCNILDFSVSAYYNSKSIGEMVSMPYSFGLKSEITSNAKCVASVEINDVLKSLGSQTILYEALATCREVSNLQDKRDEALLTLGKYKQWIEANPEAWSKIRDQIKYSVIQRREYGNASKLKSIIDSTKIKLTQTKVLELGGAPGDWTKFLDYHCKQVISISDPAGLEWYDDLRLHNTIKHDFDILKPECDTFLHDYENYFDLVISDLGRECPNHSVQESMHLPYFQKVVKIACSSLVMGGTLIFKTYEWHMSKTQKLLESLGFLFKSVKFIKPSTSLPTNSERYVVCQGFQIGRSDLSVKNIINRDTEFTISQVQSLRTYIGGIEQSDTMNRKPGSGIYKLLIESEEVYDDTILHLIHQLVVTYRIPLPVSKPKIKTKLTLFRNDFNDLFLQFKWINGDKFSVPLDESIICLLASNGSSEANYHIDVGYLHDHYQFIILRGDSNLLVRDTAQVSIIADQQIHKELWNKIVYDTTGYTDVKFIQYDQFLECHNFEDLSAIPSQVDRQKYVRTLLSNLNMRWFFRVYQNRFKNRVHAAYVHILNAIKTHAFICQATPTDYIIRNRHCTPTSTITINELGSMLYEYRNSQATTQISMPITKYHCEKKHIMSVYKTRLLSIPKEGSRIKAFSPITSAFYKCHTQGFLVHSKAERHLERILSAKAA